MFIATLKLSMIALALNIAIKPWGLWITNLAGYVLVLTSFFLPFAVIIDKREWKGHITADYLLFVGFFLMLICSILLSIGEYGMDFDLFKDVLAFVCMYATIAIEPMEYRKKDLLHIFVINKILSLILVAYTFLPFSFRYTLANEWGYYAFTLSLGNTNATAIQVFYCITIMVIENVTENGIWIKTINTTLIGALFYTLYLLQCRTIMLCSIIIVLTMVFQKIKIRRWYIWIVSALPIVAVVFQMLVTDDSITILGKGLITGRELLYADYYNTVAEAPMEYLFGSLCQHRLNNYHNGPIAIFMNMGLVGLVICMSIWIYTLRQCISNISNKTQKVAIAALMVYLIHASTEAAPMMGMLLYGTPVMVLFRLAKDKFVLDGDESAAIKQTVKKHSKYERIMRA